MKYIFYTMIFLSLLLFPRSTSIFNSNSRSGLLNLLWSKREISEISEMLPSSEIFLYNDATESQFKSISSKAKIIHFATHAKIDEEKPLFSKLILKPDADGKDDGLLHIYEIYNLKINADLVVLSACNTGMGKLTKSEGIMSLAHGFKYAGCPSLIAGLWSIDDKSTASIMKNFYSNLKQGETISSSLRNSKLTYISESISELAPPFYWAGMTAIGNDSTINFESTKSSNLPLFEKLSIIYKTLTNTLL